jgi:hypothetical protein
MIEQGMMQHWQSSPHQHGSFGFAIGPFAIDGEGEVFDDADVVDGGIVGQWLGRAGI